jgi:hypothetical protein
MMTSREHCMLVEDQEDGDVMRISWDPVRGVVRTRNARMKEHFWGRAGTTWERGQTGTLGTRHLTCCATLTPNSQPLPPRGRPETNRTGRVRSGFGSIILYVGSAYCHTPGALERLDGHAGPNLECMLDMRGRKECACIIWNYDYLVHHFNCLDRQLGESCQLAIGRFGHVEERSDLIG